MVIIAIPLLVLAFLGIRRHYRKIARRLRAGTAAVRAAGVPREPGHRSSRTRSTSRPRARSGTRSELHDGDVRALHAPGRGADIAIRPRWFKLAGREPQLEMLDPAEGRIDAVLEELWKLPRGERDVVTVVIPEQFRRRSLPARGPPNGVPPQAPPAVRAGRGRRRRARDQRQAQPRRTDADQADHPGPRRRRQRSVDARPELRPVPRRRRHPRRLLRHPARRGARARGGLAGRADPGAARGARGAVPRHRRPAAPLHPRADERPRRRR